MINKLKKYFCVLICSIFASVFTCRINAVEIFFKQNRGTYGIKRIQGVVLTSLESLATQNVHTITNIKLRLSKSKSVTIAPVLLEFYPNLCNWRSLTDLINAITGKSDYYTIDSIVARETNATEEFGIISLDIVVTPMRERMQRTPMINFRDEWSAEQLLVY